MSNSVKTDVIVIGAGVAGCNAAYRVADLGKRVTLIDQRDALGGVCLQEGCIPSKALLHISGLINQTHEMSQYGLEYESCKLNLEKINRWKDSIVKRLTGGLQFLAQKRNVKVIQGTAAFINANEIVVRAAENQQMVSFSNAIIATGSSPKQLNFLPQDSRIINSTAALDIQDPPQSLLILGGGIIGLEMATIYHALGTAVTLVEQENQLIPFADSDLVAPLYKRLIKRIKIHLKAKVSHVVAKEEGLLATFEGDNISKDPMLFERMLVSIGRSPNINELALDKAAIEINKQGFIAVNNVLQTAAPHIYAIGDVIGQPMLAHKASYEGRKAAEFIAMNNHVEFNHTPLVPVVAYTNPEIAWVGLTEKEAKAQDVSYEISVFPWIASGRAHTLNRTEGLTKLIFDSKTHQILGAGVVGVHAGDIIPELTLAIQLKATATQIANTIHPHPTLSESVMMAAEIFEGTATDVFMPKKGKKS